MRGLLSIALIAASFVARPQTQETKVKQQTKVEIDDAKLVTLTGCLRASKDGFDLTEVTSGKTRKKEPATPTMVMLRQVPGTIDLQRYVGRRVAITGAAEQNVFEDIEVEVRTKQTAEQQPQSDIKTTSKINAEVDPKGHNILVPISVREVSKTCR